MGSFIHSLHQYGILLVRYLVIFAVIGFMPIPLFSFFGGQTLQQIDHNPLFQYFNHYQISQDVILQNVYTNVFIDEKQKNIQEWDIDNAVLWADYLTYQLIEQDIPVVREVISTKKVGNVASLKSIHAESASIYPWDIPQLSQVLRNLKTNFELLLPIKSITEEARQWVIIALNSDQKSVTKQLKQLAKKYPNDNFLVLSQTPMNLNKKTLKIQLPEFNVKQAKRIISQGLKISQSQAQVLLVEHQRSLWSLNEANGDNQQFSIKSLLKQQHRPLNELSKKQQTILQDLCKNGKAKLNKKVDLSDFGVVVKGKYYQWQNDASQLSYQIQKGVLCGKTKWIDVETESTEQIQKTAEQSKQLKQSSQQLQTDKDKKEEKQQEKNEQALTQSKEL